MKYTIKSDYASVIVSSYTKAIEIARELEKNTLAPVRTIGKHLDHSLCAYCGCLADYKTIIEGLCLDCQENLNKS